MPLALWQQSLWPHYCATPALPVPPCPAPAPTPGQVRHMVGGAVAAARGLVPLELVEASLAAPARVNLPLAPAPTLVLSDAGARGGRADATAREAGEAPCFSQGGLAPARVLARSVLARSVLAPPLAARAEFSPFKKGWAGTPAVSAQWTGERLTLREGGAVAREVFERARLLPAVDRLLAGPQWTEWEGDLQRMWYDEAEAAELLAAHAAWRAGMSARKAERDAAAAAAAAAEAG